MIQMYNIREIFNNSFKQLVEDIKVLLNSDPEKKLSMSDLDQYDEYLDRIKDILLTTAYRSPDAYRSHGEFMNDITNRYLLQYFIENDMYIAYSFFYEANQLKDIDTYISDDPKENEIFFTKTKLIVNLAHDIVTQYKINELKNVYINMKNIIDIDTCFRNEV